MDLPLDHLAGLYVWFTIHAPFIGLVSILLLILVLSSFNVELRRMRMPNFGYYRRKRRERDMSSEEREKYIQRVAADYITDSLETAIEKGKLTVQEVSMLYQVIGTRCGLPDLIPRRQTLIKEAIKSRRSNGVNKPVNLPDSAPRKPQNKLEASFMRKTAA